MGYTLELEPIKAHKAGSKIFSYYATEDEETASGLGRIFVILEIATKDKATIAFASELISVLKDTFYHSPSSDVEASLELACQKANSFFLESELDHNKCYSKLSAIVVATHDERLCFSSSNNGRLLLLRKQRINHLIEPILSKTKKESGKPKLFSNITSGTVEPGDIVIASIRSVTDYFNEEKLKALLRQLKLSNAAKVISDEIQTIPSNIGFEGILLNLKKREPKLDAIITAQAIEKQTVVESMSQMNNRESATSKLLVESPVSTVKKTFNKFFHQTKTPGALPVPSIKQNNQKQEVAIPEQQIPSSKPSIVPPSIGIEAFGTRLSRLSSFLFVKNRFLTIGAILLVLFIATTLVQTKFIHVSSQDSQQLAVIKEQLNQAELALIYQNRDGALSQLKAAQDGFQLLKKPTSSEAKALMDTMDELTHTVYLITDATPETVVDLSTSPKTSSAMNVLAFKGSLYTFASNPFTLFEIKQNEKTTNEIVIPTNLTPTLVLADSETIAISDGTSIASLDLQKKEISTTSSLNTTIVAPYSGRIYAVINNGIARLDKDSKTNSWKQSPWITDNTTITEGLSMAIDGNIYIGTKQGLFKYTKGQKQSFSLPDVGYQLTPSAITTSIDSERLFILDAIKKRIIIMSKTGTLEKQLSLEAFEFPISPSLVVDEVKKTIFFHAGSSIWKVTF